MAGDEKIEYYDNSEFNEWIDSNNIVTIEDYPFIPSDVLYKIEPNLYFQLLNQYLDNEDVLVEIIKTKFPSTLSFHFSRFYDLPENDTEKLEAAKLVWQGLVQTIYVIVLSEVLMRKLPLGEVNIPVEDVFTNDTDGQVYLINKMYQYCTQRQFQLKCFNLLKVEQIIDIYQKSSIPLRKHTNHSNPESIKNSIDRQHESLIEALKLCRALKNVQFIVFDNDLQGVRLPECQCFQGENSIGSKTTVLFSQEVYENAGHFYAGNEIFIFMEGELFSLSPFLHFQNDDEGYSLALLNDLNLETGEAMYNLLGNNSTPFSHLLPNIKELMQPIKESNIIEQAFEQKETEIRSPILIDFQQLKKHIGEDDIGIVTATLTTYFDSLQNLKDEYNQFIILQTRFKTLHKQKVIQDSISDEQYNQMLNAIKVGFLELIDLLNKN